MTGQGETPAQVLVVVAEGSVAAAVRDGFRTSERSVEAVVVPPAANPVERARDEAVAGVVVGGGLDAPGATVERLRAEADLPVVLLSDDGGTVATAVEAGVTDVFPRTSTEHQYELLADRLVSGDGTAGWTPTADTNASGRDGAGETGATAGDTTPIADDSPYRRVFENVGDGLVVHDPETGEILDVNDQYCEMNGYDREELVGEDVGVVSAPGDEYSYERAYERIERAREEGTQLFEWRNQRRDGETFPVEVHLAVVRIDGTERVLASVRDVTERKRRERIIRSLHEATDDFQDADTAREVCEVAVAAGREVLDLSMPACWLHGAEEPEVLAPVAATEAAWELPLGGGGPGEFEPGDFEYEVYEDGEFRVYDPGELYEETPLDHAVLIALGDHGLFGAAEPGVDAFEESTLDAARILARHATAALDRVERERELRESERRFRLIAEHIDEIIYLATADFSEILYINQAYEEIYGQPTDALAENPRAFVEAAHPEDRDRYREDVRELVADVEAGEAGTVYEGQYRLRRDGEVRWVSVSRFPVENEAGTVDRIVGRVQDITERRRREREFEQIFNGVQDGIAVMDPETLDILDANDAYLELVGYDDLETVQELGVEGLSATGEGYTVEEGRSVHRRVAETGEPEVVEWRAATGAGDRRWLEVKVAPARIGGEDLNVAIHRDVTELRRSEQRFRTIAERVEEIIYLANADLTEVEYVNDAYADVYGRPVEELEEDPRAFVDAVHPDDRDAYEADLEAMLADIERGDPDDRYEFEFRIERPDGEVRWLDATGYPILDEAGEPRQFVGIVEDVTERHERERTLETFHEATRELTEADSREAACRHAVRAAEDVLGFPLVSAHLYDEETGRLEPTAVTTRLDDLDVEPPAFGPGESLPWQVFVDGEAATSSEPTADVYGPGVSPPDVVLPLGSHGVMLVGAPAATFGAEDVELAQILAATLEAALNHVAGERALAEREAELRRQRERVDQLERLNTVIRDIEQATVEQSSRTGIEEAVCERLVDIPRCDLAWIAESTVGDDDIVPRTSAGDEAAYVDGLVNAVGAGSEADTHGHPAVAAYRTGESRAVENVATDVAGGDWRTHALRHGVQSVVAVPITYETTTHGVLSVASSEPDAFDDATEDVLAELGRSIGYAITVTERERALESEGTTELEFAVDDEGLFMVRAARDADCRVDLERTIRRTGGSFSSFYVVDGAAPEAVVALANAAPSVETAQVVSADEEGAGGLVEVTAPSWFGSIFTEHGAVVREATATPDGGTLVVETPRGTDVRTLVEGFGERYPGSELVAQRQRERTIRSLFELRDALRSELTDRQWEALETAYSAGYFQWPRETSGQEVAELLGVSQPTFNKHLRIAERSAFRLLLDREYPGGEG